MRWTARSGREQELAKIAKRRVMSKISSKRAILTSFLVDLGDVALNVTAMIITGSVVLLAEALEGGSDLVASGLLFVGLRISKRRANKRHPFGFGKALFSWTLLSAFVMLVFGAGLSFYFGFRRFLEPEHVSHIGFAYGALCISIVTNGYGVSVSARRLLEDRPLKELGHILVSSTHVETKNTFILDVTGAGAAAVGLIALILYQATGYQGFDGLGGMLMGVIIAVCSVILIWGVKGYLAGRSAPAEIERRIRDAVLEFQEIKSVPELATMYLGSQKLLLHLDVEVGRGTTAKELGELVESLKARIKEKVPIVSTIQIEAAPSSAPADRRR
jgi:cation diffusion facilitator family transporter